MSSNDIERVIECSSQRRLVINAQSSDGAVRRIVTS